MPDDLLTSPNAVLEATAQTLTEPSEGFRSCPYLDATGTPTIGWGSTRYTDGSPVTMQTPCIPTDVAQQLLMRDMATSLAEVQSEVTVPLTTAETEALTDFIYNVGCGNFEASTLLRLLNSGDYQGAADQFLRWDLSKGVVLAGLCTRRQNERQVFLGAST